MITNFTLRIEDSAEMQHVRISGVITVLPNRLEDGRLMTFPRRDFLRGVCGEYLDGYK